MYNHAYKHTPYLLSIVSIVLVLLLCLIPALYYGSISQPSIILIYIAASLIFFISLPQQYITEGSFLISLNIEKPLSLVLVIIAASSFRSIYFFNTQMELHKWIAYLMIFITTANLFRTERRLKLLAYWIIASAVLLGLIGIAKYRSMPLFLNLWPRAEFSTFVSRNSFHIYMSAGLSLTIALLFCDIRIRAKILLGLAAFFLITSLVLSYDKGGWLGFCALILFLFVLLGKEGLLKGGFWFIVLSVTVFLWIVALSAKFDVVIGKIISVFLLSPKDAFYADYDTTLWTRISIWKSSLRLILQHPLLGVGLGNFKLAYPALRERIIYNQVGYAHQDYLQFAVETGVLGLVSLFWLGLSFFKKIISEAGPRQNSFITGLKVGALAGCFGISFYALHDFSFHIPANALLFAVLCGSLTAIRLMRYDPKIKSENKIVKFLYLPCALVLICYIAYSGRLFAANMNYEKGLLAADRFSFTRAEGYFKKALSCVPHNAEYAARLGELYAHRSKFKDDSASYQKKAVALYKEALSIDPYDGNLRVEAAVADAGYGLKREAEGEFKKALALDPNNAFYRAILTEYAIEWGDLDTAKEGLNLDKRIPR